MDFIPHGREIVSAFLRLGATSYGGPAIMGVMQAELQERRQWLSEPRFLEGLALVNMLPGATATQLALFLGHARGGWWGALLGGICFVLPAFAIMLALTVAYAALGVSPLVRGALYGLTAQEFIDGLALGQFTPGPILMVAAYVGYKVAGVAGAAVAAGAAFLPSFVMMLAILPAFDRVRTYTWTRAVLRGMSPAVIGLLAVSLTRLAPYALVDPFAVAIFVATVAALLLWRPGTVRLMLGGAVLGALRNRWFPLPGIR